ncbi:hypothetical protein F5144DRAFT_594972 [Chaetomium tenue]|uniref:Uncharacterized protein n=1 Tax=Chaetomium tenue TaxID=1854479 RepID=A0ACB7P027_9PEZI|nr:hypothetical protein F5144DRAFT_594972 [Chaetomium globosum]
MNPWPRHCFEVARVGWPYSSSTMGGVLDVPTYGGRHKAHNIPPAILLTSVQGHRFICPQNPHVASGFEQTASGHVDTIRRRLGCLSSLALKRFEQTASGHADFIGLRRLGCLSSWALSSRKQPQKLPNPQIGLHPMTGCRRKDNGRGGQAAGCAKQALSHYQERLRSVMVDVWASAAVKAISEADILMMEGPLSGLSCRWRKVRASPLGNTSPQSPEMYPMEFSSAV